MKFYLSKPTIEVKTDGSLVISDLVNYQLVRRQYFGYSKREAIKKFKAEILSK